MTLEEKHKSLTNKEVDAVALSTSIHFYITPLNKYEQYL